MKNKIKAIIIKNGLQGVHAEKAAVEILELLKGIK